MLAAVIGVAALGGASVTTDCGTVPADLDGSTQDANVDHVGRLDGAVDADVPATSYCGATCPDAGYFITIGGDGPAQILRSNGFPIGLYAVTPNAPWAQAHYGPGLTLGGSEYADGGVSLLLDVQMQVNADGGLTVLGPGSPYSFAYYTGRGGTLFSLIPADAGSMTLTEVDQPGGFVAGSYAVRVEDSAQPDASLSLSGTFLTCRLCDYVGTTPPHP